MKAVRFVAGGVLLGALAILLWQIVEKDTPPDTTTLGLFVVATLSVAALLKPLAVRALLNRITSFDVLGVKVELEVDRARRVAARFPDEEDRVPTPARPRHPNDPRREIKEVQDELPRKLRFIRGSVLDDPRSLPELLVVARLEYLRLLGLDEATLSRELLTDLPDQIVKWDDDEQESFLDNAWRFAFRLATRIFDRHARQRFKEQGWFVGDFEQTAGHRAEFLVTKDDQWACVAARVASPRTSIDPTVDRLASAGPPRPEAQPVIVVPDFVHGLWDEIDDGPIRLSDGRVMVVRLSHLLEKPPLLAGVGVEPGEDHDEVLLGGDIEQRDHEKTVAVLRELAGLRTRVPSHGDSGDRPPFRAAELNELRERVRELAQAIVDGGTMDQSRGSVAASSGAAAKAYRAAHPCRADMRTGKTPVRTTGRRLTEHSCRCRFRVRMSHKRSRREAPPNEAQIATGATGRATCRTSAKRTRVTLPGLLTRAEIGSYWPDFGLCDSLA